MFAPHAYACQASVDRKSIAAGSPGAAVLERRKTRTRTLSRTAETLAQLARVPWKWNQGQADALRAAVASSRSRREETDGVELADASGPAVSSACIRVGAVHARAAGVHRRDSV